MTGWLLEFMQSYYIGGDRCGFQTFQEKFEAKPIAFLLLEIGRGTQRGHLLFCVANKFLLFDFPRFGFPYGYGKLLVILAGRHVGLQEC